MIYIWMRVRGRVGATTVDAGALSESRLAGPVAVLIPCWREARVIGATVSHALAAWPDPEVRIAIGCYRNDPDTLAVAGALAEGDHRVEVVVNPVAGPTSKADCLNKLFSALEIQEDRQGKRVRMVVVHDAEDMVDPLGLKLMDAALHYADFVQLPVLPLPKPGSPFVAGHYVDEFCEAHAKVMAVRDGLGVGLPGAGVGFAVARETLGKLSDLRDGAGPFAVDSLTEDYEFGLGIAEVGARSRFLRMRTRDGRLIATRAYFPSGLSQSVRQKTRWVHGIALQGWDRMGWGPGLARRWFDLRDRRGPFAALLLFVAYSLLVATAGIGIAQALGVLPTVQAGFVLKVLLAANLAALLWRAGVRAAFTGREFGWREGLLAILRIPVSNAIAILAGRRAIAAYIATLRGAPLVWEKTEHTDHPVFDDRVGAGHG